MTETTQQRHPLSLKWKWSILLFVALTTVSTIGLLSYNRYANETALRQQTSIAQQQFDRTVAYFQKIDTPLEKYHFDTTTDGMATSKVKEDISRFFSLVEAEDTIVKLFNTSNQLLYETRNIGLPTQRYDSEIQQVQVGNDFAFAATQKIVSTVTHHPLGTLQMVFVPKAFNAAHQERQLLMNRTIIFMLLASVILAFGISQYLLRPLDYLNNALDLVEEESLSEIRIRKPRSNDEWSDLNIHINRLLDKIDLYVRNQKQFVEDVSHELRTPVAIVEGHLKMLNRWGKDDPEILEESISASLQEITRMKDLVQEMLDLSRADHANVDYKDEITEVYSTVQQVYNNFVILYPNFKFYLDSEKGGKELYIKMYRNHFEQILIILLDNAVKYSLDRHEVHLSVSASFTKVEIAVQDFGEGMTEEDKDRVFGRFYRVDKARSRNKGGNGLGLSIAKQLVEGYKGKIHVESVLNHGSIFYVEFPIIIDQSEIKKHQQLAVKKAI
ncbi:HAMP domain-containing histidine kinase [Aerococcaceae bacterium NML160702]|nr:HAMP domain-containing histidine kinase [Aerococcaceae bacterium NML160702]